ncbi:TPA: hypothetical protein DCZ32_03480 [Candidatus Uhrbacteria bacterium]|nr:hypothetical protein [Candidatus Uhrbacteria bacterium]
MNCGSSSGGCGAGAGSGAGSGCSAGTGSGCSTGGKTTGVGTFLFKVENTYIAPAIINPRKTIPTARIGTDNIFLFFFAAIGALAGPCTGILTSFFCS